MTDFYFSVCPKPVRELAKETIKEIDRIKDKLTRR
jgi:hypothetical protein